MHVTQAIRPASINNETPDETSVAEAREMFEMFPFAEARGRCVDGLVGGSQRTMQDRIYPQRLNPWADQGENG